MKLNSAALKAEGRERADHLDYLFLVPRLKDGQEAGG